MFRILSIPRPSGIKMTIIAIFHLLSCLTDPTCLLDQLQSLNSLLNFDLRFLLAIKHPLLGFDDPLHFQSRFDKLVIAAQLTA